MQIKEFAERVERLCEFLLEKGPIDDDREVIEHLKEAAADLQFSHDYPTLFEGLSNHMRGLIPKESE
jgi:hypothetical protein